MCGRTACTLDPGVLCKACAYRSKETGTYREAEWRESPNGRDYRKCANLSPTMYSPILVAKKTLDKSASEEERVIQPMMWGIIPPWHQEGKPTGHGLTTNNCRIEGIADKRLYGLPLKRGNRCVVLCNGFYEWKFVKQGPKQPYFIYFPQPPGIQIENEETWENRIDELWSEKNGWTGPKPLKMAGIFDMWKNPEDGSLIYSYSVVTMGSSSAVNWIHERMPAILDDEEQVNVWLNSSKIPYQEALAALKPSVNLVTHPVSTLVNSVKNQDLNLTKRVEPSPVKAKETGSSKFMAAWLKKASPAKVEPSVKNEIKDKETFPSKRNIMNDIEDLPSSKKVKEEQNSL